MPWTRFTFHFGWHKVVQGFKNILSYFVYTCDHIQKLFPQWQHMKTEQFNTLARAPARSYIHTFLFYVNCDNAIFLILTHSMIHIRISYGVSSYLRINTLYLGRAMITRSHYFNILLSDSVMFTLQLEDKLGC